MYSLCPKWQAVDEIIIIGYTIVMERLQPLCWRMWSSRRRINRNVSVVNFSPFIINSPTPQWRSDSCH